MYIRRKSTRLNKYADYCLSIDPIETCQYEAYTTPNHTFYEDIKITEKIIFLRKEEVERRFGLKLDSLEQIKI